MKIPEPLTKMGHALFGFTSALAAAVNPIFFPTSAALFVIYELNEEWGLGDEAYEEIREYLYGVSAAYLLLILKGLVVG